jgi:hypothetical protein
MNRRCRLVSRARAPCLRVIDRYQPVLKLAVPELVGDARHAQQSGVTAPIQKRAESHRAGAAQGPD